MNLDEPLSYRASWTVLIGCIVVIFLIYAIPTYVRRTHPEWCHSLPETIANACLGR